MVIDRKICILTSVHSPFDVRIFHKEAKSLIKGGYDVTLIAQHEKSEIVEGIKIIALPKQKNRFARMTKTVWMIFKLALKENAEIYHFHDPELMPLAKLMSLMGKLVIYDMHENVPRQINDKGWINPSLKKLVAKCVALSERIFLSGIPVIFAENSYYKDYLWVKTFTSVLNMPLIDKLNFREKARSKKLKFTVGYMGSISEKRGILTTIEALRILKNDGVNIRFECVGPIYGYSQKQLLELCVTYNLDSVFFHGKMAAHEGWSVVNECDIGIATLHPIPNYIESYPTKLFEYMAMGLPVITSNFPLYEKIIVDAKCGICVDPLNPREIAHAINSLVVDSELAVKMGDNGRKAVEENYNWRNEEKKLLDFYRNISL